MNRVLLVIITSTLAIIALVFFQVKWMQQSRDLIEEQFNNKVKMALCSAIERIDPSKKEQIQLAQQDLIKTPLIATPYDTAALDAVLIPTLKFYGIDLKYKVLVSEQAATCNTSYCCALDPISDHNGFISLDFPEKKQYIQNKMRFMLISSIVIVSFISIVFLLANYTLLRQKRVSKINMDFFNNMAHELRTPLANIKLATKLLIRKNQDLKTNNYLQIIQHEDQKLIQQVERFLQLAKMENGTYQLQKEAIELDMLVEDVVKEMQLRLDETGAEIRIEKQEGDWNIIGDKFHLGNVFRNLIDNALKYSEVAPKITITFQKQKNGILILFKDNGIGISKANHTLIFKKFHRIQTGNRHDQKGFGLGLAYVKMIIERHQGFVKIFSELNKGSRFDLFLPQPN